MKKKFTTTMEESTIKEMKVLAIKQKRSVGDMIHWLFERYKTEVPTLNVKEIVEVLYGK